jgi:hypothetical protein
MRKLILLVPVALGLLGLGYAAYPLLTAWSIREAIRAGDAGYLGAKVEWESVRASMRQSLAAAALDSPAAQAGDARGGRAGPALWRRFRAYFAARAVNRIVDAYVTPAGFSQLFSYRKLYRDHVVGEEEATALPWHVRFARFWTRVKRAEFQTPARFEIEMADRDNPSRHYIGLFELRGLEWKLTALRVRLVSPLAPADEAGRS